MGPMPGYLMRTYTSALRMPKREHKKAKAFDRKNRNCKVARTGQRNRYGCGRAENYSLWVGKMIEALRASRQNGNRRL